ncbi:hypothetical protein F8M41_000010 [Gigaspora margarita]|uniref:Galactose oxidase n=1 Tax=Gigaspora margarita TaxID=4874 RepID=A0A8H4B5N2_GIGMA|nr:hypothetical protein F8M41_000010 [Gigaspora margarita]
MAASEDIGPLASHCVVTYKNSFYIFGGTIGCNTWASTNFFHYATPPFSQGKISWQPLSTTNVKSVTDPGCIVDETRGLLFVLGGKNQQINSTSPGLQVYDFNTQIWNDPKYSQNFIPRDLINDNWGPRAVWLQPGLMFMWGANSTTQGSYLLDINVTPWQWTILSDSKNNIVPTKSAGVVAIKGNAFIFGGFHEFDSSSINQTLYIYSPKYGFMTPKFQLPVPFNDGVIGVWNNKLSIIMMDTFGAVMEVVNFDLKTFQFENVISAPFSQTITTKRNRGYGAQFSWSDSVFIYGGTAGYCSQPILDTWVVYNMSSQTWERTFNDTKHKNIVSDDLTLPKVDDHDIDNEDTAVPQSTSDNSKILIIIIIILSSIFVISLILFTVVFICMKRMINRYKESDNHPMLDHSEKSATRVVS